MAKKYKLIFKDCSELDDKFSDIEKEKIDDVLTAIKNKLSVRDTQCIKIENDVEEDEDRAILYSPFESFQKKWTAGLYVGEAYVNIDEKRLKGIYHLMIKPRFGEHFLIHMLEEMYNFKMPKLDVSSKLNAKNWNNLLQLILRKLWLIKFAKADKYGLPRKTVKRYFEGSTIMGQINVQKSILPFFCKGEVVSEYYEKDCDAIIGRIVYSAYRVLANNKHTLNGIPPQVKESINSLHTRFGQIKNRVTKSEYEGIQYKRVYESWKPLVDFSWQIINHNGLNPSDVENKDGYALFFDISEIWECYMASLIKKWFVHCTNQNSRYQLFDFGQKIIPDYLSRSIINDDGGEVRAVGDAKYMDLYGKKSLHGEQCYSVYYKTIMYMYRFRSKEGYIFYPHQTEDEGCTEIVYDIMDTEGTFHMIGIHVPSTEKDGWEEKMKRNVEKLGKKIDEVFDSKR